MERPDSALSRRLPSRRHRRLERVGQFASKNACPLDLSLRQASPSAHAGSTGHELGHFAEFRSASSDSVFREGSLCRLLSCERELVKLDKEAPADMNAISSICETIL